MLKDRFFIAYNYLTIVIWYGVILLISSIPDLDLKGSSLDWTLSSLGYALMYAFLFLLILRALLATFRLKVKRLMYFRSKGERAEDTEFARITELLIFLIAFLAAVLFSAFDEYFQSMVAGRVVTVMDVMFNALGMTIVAVVAFGFPIITEFETRIFHSATSRSKHKS